MILAKSWAALVPTPVRKERGSCTRRHRRCSNAVGARGCKDFKGCIDRKNATHDFGLTIAGRSSYPRHPPLLKRVEGNIPASRVSDENLKL